MWIMTNNIICAKNVCLYEETSIFCMSVVYINQTFLPRPNPEMMAVVNRWSLFFFSCCCCYSPWPCYLYWDQRWPLWTSFNFNNFNNSTQSNQFNQFNFKDIEDFKNVKKTIKKNFNQFCTQAVVLSSVWPCLTHNWKISLFKMQIHKISTA